MFLIADSGIEDMLPVRRITPGSEIPKGYHDFVRRGDAERVSDILRHNGLGLLTMSDLTSKLFSSEA